MFKYHWSMSSYFPWTASAETLLGPAHVTFSSTDKGEPVTILKVGEEVVMELPNHAVTLPVLILAMEGIISARLDAALPTLPVMRTAGKSRPSRYLWGSA